MSVINLLFDCMAVIFLLCCIVLVLNVTMYLVRRMRRDYAPNRTKIKHGQYVMVRDGVVVINGEIAPELPGGEKVTSVSQINHRVFANGYELINGEWVRNLSAMYHLVV